MTKKTNNSVRAWRVENSWGTFQGDKGYLCMTDAWFDEWVYQIAINKHLLSTEVLNALRGEPIVLPYWDPMGALATN